VSPLIRLIYAAALNNKVDPDVDPEAWDLLNYIENEYSSWPLETHSDYVNLFIELLDEEGCEE
jgi:hypothetical protein